LVRELRDEPWGQLLPVVRVESIPEHAVMFISGDPMRLDEGLAEDKKLVVVSHDVLSIAHTHPAVVMDEVIELLF